MWDGNCAWDIIQLQVCRNFRIITGKRMINDYLIESIFVIQYDFWIVQAYWIGSRC